jgi:predicted HAD superfamily Cof-like phosphohydrolase
MISDVTRFHRKYGQPVADGPSFPAPDRMRLRQDLHKEECRELNEAIDVCLAMYSDGGRYTTAQEKQALAAVLKEVCDLVFVTLGTVLEFGFHRVFAAAWSAVSASNLTKDGGSNALGKVTKGPSYVAPDLHKVLWGKESE